MLCWLLGTSVLKIDDVALDWVLPWDMVDKSSNPLRTLCWLLGTSVHKLAVCINPISLFFHFTLVK
jgi:hypothetical protein